MGLTCDLVVQGGDGRQFEWVLFLRTDSMPEAVAIAEREVAQRDSTARIVELNLQVQGEGADNEQEVHVALVRAIGREAAPTAHVFNWLKAKLGFAAQNESRP